MGKETLLMLTAPIFSKGPRPHHTRNERPTIATSREGLAPVPGLGLVNPSGLELAEKIFDGADAFVHEFGLLVGKERWTSKLAL